MKCYLLTKFLKMKKIVAFTFFILISFFSISQEKSNDTLNSIIEELSNYSVMIDGAEVQYLTNIDLNTKTGRIKITDTKDYSIKYIETVISFYLKDLDLESLKYRITETDDGKFGIMFEISTLNNTVEYSEVIFEGGKEYTRVSEINSSDLIRMTANGKTMSMDSAQKYVDSWMELLGITRAKEIKN